MVNLKKLISIVTLATGGVTGSVVLYSIWNKSKVTNNEIKTNVKVHGVDVSYVTEKNGTIGIKSFTMGQPAV